MTRGTGSFSAEAVPRFLSEPPSPSAGTMIFLWPELLFLLLIVPLATIAYQRQVSRQRKRASHFAGLVSTNAADASRSWAPHVAPLLFTVAMTLMLIAIARPVAVITMASRYDTVILAIDISDSMLADDIAPNRIAAAKAAARELVAGKPHSIRVGLVAFCATASLVQTPTTHSDALLAAIDGLQAQPGTAIGSAILVSLATIFPEQQFSFTPPEIVPGMPRDAPGTLQHHAHPSGLDTSAAIILLTDGRATLGPDPVLSSKIAAELGVRIFTVGIGSTETAMLNRDTWGMEIRLDEESLQEIARMTQAEYFYADNAGKLKNVYGTLRSRLVPENREEELTALFAAASLLFALASGLFSMLRFQRIL